MNLCVMLRNGQSWMQPAYLLVLVEMLRVSGLPQGSKWQVGWRTDSSDHGGHAVTALAYAPVLAGLPGGDGHTGWLISASRQLLNLWETSASGGKGEPSLQARCCCCCVPLC